MAEEEEASFVPMFQSSQTVYRVQMGNTARLECSVDRLGPMVLSWKKVNQNISEYIVTGRTVMTGGSKKISVLTSSSSSILMLSNVGHEDVGEYQCEVSSTPPVHMTHWIRLKQKPKVNILGKSLISLKEGQELGLVCKVIYNIPANLDEHYRSLSLQGEGEPPPVLSWKREVAK